jgi:hypothetical protein
VALLDIVQSVCDEVGLPRPSAVATSSDQLARQLFSLANAALKELSKRHEWPILQREYTFPTANGTEAYALPADFRAMIGNTVYNRSIFYQLKGSVTPQEWQRTKALNLGTLSRARVRIYGSPLQMHLLPTPIGVDTLVFEYLTNKFAVSAGGVPQDKYVVDTDVAVVDEDLVRMGLKWRIKHAKGLEFSADLSEYESVVSSEYARSLASGSIDIGGRSLDSTGLTTGYVPDSGFGT